MAFASRVTQLDAKSLDEESASLIHEQFSHVFKYCGQSLYTQFEPELYALVRLYIQICTVVNNKQSVGQGLVQLQYSSDISKGSLKRFVVAQNFFAWFKKRAPHLYVLKNSSSMREASMKLTNCLEIIYKTCELANIFMFLREGLYPSLLERLFQLKYSSVPKQGMRQIAYNYFTRELLWNGFTDILAFVLPLINITHFHNFIRQFLPSQSRTEQEKLEPNVDKSTKCCVCNEDLILPHAIGCTHVGCYYCLYSKMLENPKYACPLCNYEIESSLNIVPVVMPQILFA